MKLRLLLIIFILYPLVTMGQAVEGRITYVSDGDTFHLVTPAGEKLKVRLADVDCPEKVQDFGLEAKEFSMSQIKDKQVQLIIINTDRYGRKVARVKYEGKDLSEELVRNGFAWHYKQYSDDEQLANLETQAREGRVGLWRESSPVAPWEFRRSRK